MELRALGRTGIAVSPLGLGTTKFGRNEQVKYPKPFELPSDEHLALLLRSARRLGVNLIDTAPAYGTSEERLGRLLRDRSDWVIVTKAGEEFGDGRSRFDFSAQAITRSVHRSLERLQTDRIDIVLLHSDGNDEASTLCGDALEALRALRDGGAIRAIGASTKTVAGGLLAVERCDVVMLAFNREDRSQAPVVEAARRAGVGVLVKKPLASGHDSDPARALAEVARLPGVTSVVTGTLDPEHLSANARAVSQATTAPGGSRSAG